jgi:glycosyltransferase involved in cell wall biosynthesis
VKKKKIMHILNSNSYSGAENVVITLIHTSDDKVDSVYVSPNGSICEILHQNNVEYYPVEKVTPLSIKQAICDINPDIIHAHDFTAGIVSSVVSKKIPVLNHLHNNSPWIKRLSPKSIAYGLSCYRYKKILTVSDSVMDEFIFGSKFREKTIMVGNPIDIHVVQEKAREEIVEKDIEIQHTDVVFLGRLTPQKNIFLLLEILKDLKKRKPDLLVSIIGDGELRVKFEEKIAEYQLQDNIVLYGFQKNPYPYLNASKVMCMPSAWEGFGLAAVEGLALAKPVIAAPVGGLVNIISDSCGKLCNEKNEYVDEIYKLLCDSDYYNKLSRGALKRAKELDNINEYTNQILNIYKLILKDACL